MANDLPAVPDDDRKEKARELWTWCVELRAAGEALAIDWGEALKNIYEGQFWKDWGFESFEAAALTIFGVSKETAHRHIRVIKNVIEMLPADLSTRLTTGPKALPLKILAAIRPDSLKVPTEEIERLRQLTDEELRAEIVRMGYDRRRMGGRGPSDLSRRLVSRNVHRDQSKTVILLKEKIRNRDDEAEERDRVIAQLQEELKRKNEILMADDKTRAYELQVEQMAQTIATYHTAEHKAAAEKIDREAAIRLIAETRVVVFRLLREFRERIHVPDVEVASWLEMCFDQMRSDLQQTHDFVASEALKIIGEGGDVPLADAAAAMRQLTNPYRINMEKLGVELGLVEKLGAGGKDEHRRTPTNTDQRPGKKG